jgi:ABC-type glutathione transport system ATPase component
MAAAISAQQLAVTFARRGRAAAVAALQPLDFEIASGCIVGLLGQ